ncbi:asparagine synthase-related protein [Streptomyces sp. NPDC048506]|uniref:asparagine synthase-related protein n=1 Tax=Streptomyces sp. NPDC048506 TaxID=3155028 RepID=UPI00341FA585
MDFLVFPDHPATDALTRCLPASPSRRTLHHPSGRPWITGHWSPDEALTAEAGPRRAVLLGTAAATGDSLARLLHGPGHLDGIGERARRIPGSHFLLTAVDGDLRCRGDLATVRQIHHTRTGGVTVAGNRPQDLAALTRAAALAGLPLGTPGSGSVDEEALALRLLFPYAPLPLALRPLWRSVPAVPPGHHLTLYANGRHSLARWWQAPEPEVPLEHAAETVRRALTNAMAARAQRARRQAGIHGDRGEGRGTLSADLSGSTGSTGLCFLAARQDVRLITTSWTHRDAGPEDALWSARSAAHLLAADRQRTRSAGPGPGTPTVPGAGKGTRRSRRRGRVAADEPPPPPGGAHLPLPYTDVPTWYTPPTHPVHTGPADPAAPLAVIREAARILHRSRLVAEHGSRLHLVGIGGDELFAHRPVALNSLARRAPYTAARRAWTAHHLCRWTAPDTLGTLFGGRSYPQWLAGCTRHVAAGTGPRSAGADWETVPGLPPWTHPDAVATVRRLLREAAAERPEPFAPLRSQHEALRAAVHAGETVRGTDALTAPYHVGCEAPFLDDAVIEAALALHLADRTRAGVHQPLLTRALHGIVPDGVLGRGAAPELTAEVHSGLRTHRGDLSALCDDSLLAERGLIHPEVLRQHLTSRRPHPHAVRGLDPTLATEYWLRALAPTDVPAPAVPLTTTAGPRLVPT